MTLETINLKIRRLLKNVAPGRAAALLESQLAEVIGTAIPDPTERNTVVEHIIDNLREDVSTFAARRVWQ